MICKILLLEELFALSLKVLSSAVSLHGLFRKNKLTVGDEVLRELRERTGALARARLRVGLLALSDDADLRRTGDTSQLLIEQL